MAATPSPDALPGLAVLYLDRSTITEEALRHLTGATNLQVLSLSGVPLTGQGLRYLKAVPKLKHLNIQGCGLGFEDIDNFQAARPEVKLE